MKTFILAGGLVTRIAGPRPRVICKGKTFAVRVRITNITDASEKR